MAPSTHRYARQESLQEIGKEGQSKIGNSSVCIIGCGGLGSIAAPYLAGAGVGRIILVDGDRPEISNVHRQIVFTGNEKTSKAKSLADHIARLNPEIEIIVFPEMLDKDNIDQITSQADIVLECSDSIHCKYLVNDYCHMENIPMIYGAIYQYEGYLCFFSNRDQKDIHLRDIFPEPDPNIPSCSEVGVLNTIAGLIGILQANEAIKYILGWEGILNGTLLSYDVRDNAQMKLKLKKNWNQNMEEIFEFNSYKEIACDIPEISVTALKKSISDYALVSLLEDRENEFLSENTIHIPFSKFQSSHWKEKSVPQVFYCLSGRRSRQVIEKIKLQDPLAEVFSLQGGLKAWKRELTKGES